MLGKAERLKFDTYEVDIKPEYLRFDEQSLSTYIQKESCWYDYYGAYLALAERFLHNKETAHEKIWAERFIEAKENGASDKLAESKAKADDVVNEFKKEISEAKYIVNRLKNHLKSWDKNHDNAQSLGHTLRRQMDKLNGDIRGSHGYQPSAEPEPDPKPHFGSGFEDTLSPDNLF